ncbi:MAG: sigma-54-dependent Fis family transcriptional regulator [Deltaproteobacteria bacterium]|nr:sigma-54-dependent Fis family transcriptional regulator [Deltaproteobacteria bacterium]
MDEVRGFVRRAAELHEPVLVLGQTGTGKNVVARAIHDCGPRRDGPFVTVTCPNIPPTLIEGQLFGYRRGAFTGATSDHPGLLASAQGGTVFLDEIGALPMELQRKLLHAVEERRVLPLGAVREVQFDARIVAATNRDLRAAVEEGAFAEDLYYRLAVLCLELPPVRERLADIVPLFEVFLDRAARQQGRAPPALTAAAIACLARYGWPGNVREVCNCAHRVVAFGRTDEVRPCDLPVEIAGDADDAAAGGGTNHGQSGVRTLAQWEAVHIVDTMKLAGGVRRVAANLLGISLKTLGRKLRAAGRLGVAGSDGAGE